MGVMTRNRSGNLARALMAQQKTLKELAVATGLPYRRIVRINNGVHTLESERILIATVLGVGVETVWPLSVAGGDIQPALLRKLVADLLADDDLCFLLARSFAKIRERYA